MSDFHIATVEITDPEADPGAIRPLLEAWVALDAIVWAEVFGHDDFAQAPSSVIHGLGRQQNYRKVQLLAIAGPPRWPIGPYGLPQAQADSDVTDVEVIGGCGLSNSKNENTHVLGGLEIVVRGDWRRRGVGTAVHEAAEQIARQWHCTTLMSWGTHQPGSGDEALHPSEGVFSIAPDAASSMALRLGYELAQCERHSTQTVPDAAVAMPEAPEGYEIVQWRDRTPVEYEQSFCRLLEAMSRDVPKGDLDIEDEVWTVERLHTSQDNNYAVNEGLVTAVKHSASGELAGYTELSRDRTIDHVAWQDTTIVLGEHRGHGLGRLLKLANLVPLQTEWPTVRRVHTWNAGENRWMLAINDELGYEIATVGGAWQKKLPQA